MLLFARYLVSTRFFEGRFPLMTDTEAVVLMRLSNDFH